MKPIIEEIDFINPQLALKCFRDFSPCLFESAAPKHSSSQYSFLTIDFAQSRLFDSNHYPQIKPYIQSLKQKLDIQKHPELPPFQGGVIGALSYDLGHLIMHSDSKFNSTLAIIRVIDQVIAFDHLQNRAWICCSGLDNLTPSPQKASSQIKKNKNLLKPSSHSPCLMPTLSGVAPDHHFIDAVQKTKDHIENGDIFQANITQAFMAPFLGDPIDLYLTLQHQNPAPFSAYFQHGSLNILSSSPERFIQVFNDQIIQTSPIKGTISRSSDLIKDQESQRALLNSTKDQQENTMIVDLMRNDLGKVSKIGSVKVLKLNELQSFTHVHHLVSTITSTLKSEYDAVDALFACFPGGSITGAPKHQSMQIIKALEYTPRGFYCGSLFYLTPEGDLDSNILIRSLILHEQTLYAQAGCGITYQSDPQQEWHECLTKLKSFT